jgi:hypothetical protein
VATKSDFTEQEWETLHKGVTGAGLLVSVSDRGFFDTFKEAGALAKHLGEARKSSDSELLRELAQERSTGFGLTASPSEIEQETLSSLRAAMDTLERKAPEDAVAYRQFVLDVAESVGAAASGGDEKERAATEKIREALGATTGP